MSEWKINKNVDVAGLLSIFTVFTVIFGWGVSVEKRLSHQVPAELFYKVVKDISDTYNTRIKEINDNTRNDIQFLGSRIDEIMLKHKISEQ